MCPISCVLRPASNILCHMSWCVLHPTSYILCCLCYVLHPSSYIQRSASCVLHPTSYILRHTSYILLPASYVLRPMSCTLWPASFFLRPAFCILSGPTNYFVTPNSSLDWVGLWQLEVPSLLTLFYICFTVNLSHRNTIFGILLEWKIVTYPSNILANEK